MDTLTDDIIILKLNELWDCDIPFGWIPISGDRFVKDTEIYQSDYFNGEVNIRGVMKHVYGISDIIEIQEGGLVLHKKISECNFYYDGLEYIYTDRDFRFVLYFSHESSVTVGGRKILDTIHEIWPDYKKRIWTSPFYD